jgi:hypothetical protein
MKTIFETRHSPWERRRSQAAFTIIECMVYSGVYVLLLGLAFFAFYRCFDNLKNLRRTSDDITRAVHAGETWRGDVRAASAPIQLNEAEQTLRIQCGNREVSYRFADGQVFRKPSADAPWTVLLGKVQRSEMQSDRRARVTAWRWDLELQTKQKTVRVKPLFTFVAAPPQP